MTSAIDDLDGRLGAGGVDVVRNRPLGEFTTYGVGGPARLFVELSTTSELTVLASAVSQCPEVEVLVLGNGSNLLIADAGFPGIVIRLSGFDDVAVEGSAVVAGGAALLPVVARRSVAAGLGGFEWAVGVPGTVGGAVRMNAGGHGSDIAATLRRVHRCDLSTGETGWMPATMLRLGYRTSAIETHHVVTAAEFGLEPSPAEVGEARLREIVRWRRANQPGGHNAGSVFRNPPDGRSAGGLVEAAGCKGLRLGSAHISTKHANFIQVEPDGSADDVYRLIDAVRTTVRERLGVDLRAENELLGFHDAPPPTPPPSTRTNSQRNEGDLP